MLQEIINQPNAWQATIQQVEAQGSLLREILSSSEEVVFTGCGSGLNAAMAITPIFQHVTGVRARAVPAAEIVFFPETVFVSGVRYAVVLLSRSGSTTETVRACHVAIQRSIPTLGITCSQESALARASSATVVLAAAKETSVTTTQSLTSMILTGQVLAGIVAGNEPYLSQLRQLPALGGKVIAGCSELGRALGEMPSLSKFAFVGSAANIGLAREAQLKMKEMTLLPSDSYPILDYRHGPKSGVDAQTLITVFTTDRTRSVELEFIAEMKELGGRVFVLCERADGTIRSMADWVFEVGSGLPDFAREILYMPPVHFLAYYKALALGLSPSTPANLSYWIATRDL